MHFTLVWFKIMVLGGCRIKLILDISKNKLHTTLLSRTQRDRAEWLPHCSSNIHLHFLSHCNQPRDCKYLSFSRYTAVPSMSPSKFANYPLYICSDLDFLGCLILVYVAVSAVSFVCISSSQSLESSLYLFRILKEKDFLTVVFSKVWFDLFIFFICFQLWCVVISDSFWVLFLYCFHGVLLIVC
jgi:hypothetical protein